ncbi:MAG: nucleotidyltransferase domain-containing protein [Gammaproteobacteria bacterium]|nr:nucleotidyltransferase domain-containing protein [Gammaproteobacteria bacterium]
MPPIDITPEQYETISSLLRRHLPGVEAWAYGSRAKWSSGPRSDLDMVVFSKPDQQRQVADLREAFEESDLPFRVDLFGNYMPDRQNDFLSCFTLDKAD